MGEQQPAHDEGAPQPGGGFVAAERARRLAVLDGLRARGIDPYPVGFARDHTVAQARQEGADLAADTHTEQAVRLAGRVMALRRHGGLLFADLRDQTGTIQLLVARDGVGDVAYRDAQALNRGDWVGVDGTLMTTRTGELSVGVSACRLLSKSLRALPDPRSGLTDVDTRYRERYLDLIVNPDTRRIFDIRSAAIAAIRRTFVERGFVEVETPVLDTAAGGAAARPFVTHHNALDIDMYLRIALELPLKRLVVGGFERVFEIGRVFRNEGLDTRHNPEFTLLEAYQALGDYHDMMELVETVCSQAALAATGTTKIQVQGQEVDLAPPWRRVTMAELIEERTGARMHPSMPIGEARAICDRHHVAYESGWTAGRLMSEVYDETGESTLIAPTFVYDYPRDVSPLARSHRDDPALVERFEAVVAGRELANAYSELNDPVDQRSRFETEAANKAAGDDEAEDVDEDYIRALEYGLPPTGGLGIGIDRLVMLIAGAPTIREVILFPTMRPEGGAGPSTARRGATAAVPTAQGLADAAAAVEVGAPDPPPASDVTAMAAPPAREMPTGPAAKVLAWLTAIVGVIYLLPAVPRVHGRLGLADDYLLPVDGRVAVHVISVVVGLAMIVVAPALSHRKQRAWAVAVGLFSIAAAAAILKGPHPIAGLMAVAMLVALVACREAFPARSDPGSFLAIVRFVPLYLAGVLVFGVLSLVLQQDRITPALSVDGVLETVFGGLVGLDGPYTYQGRFLSEFYPAALLTLGLLGILTVSLLAYRAIADHGAPTPEQRRRARAIVRAWGSDTLAPFALRPDKSYFFTADGEAMVAYTFVAGYALVSADPIGPPGCTARALDEFLAFCRERAWKIAFLAVREGDLPLYRARGFHGVYMGDEAVIACDTFTLEGSAMKPVRKAVSRIGRDHTFSLMRETDVSPAMVTELNAIRERWRGKAPERGFTMELGRKVGVEQPDFLIAVAYDAAHHPVGFLRLVPCYGPDPAYSLDLMQRDPAAPNGLTEFLIASSALALGDRGFRRLSMNFAAWGRLFDEDIELSLLQRMARALIALGNPFFQIRSLRVFNEKFQPMWLPRSIVVEDASAAPKVGLLYASVEGFVRLPLVGRYLVPRTEPEPEPLTPRRRPRARRAATGSRSA